MGSIKPLDKVQGAEERFESLRHAFRARLQSERMQLVGLSAALAGAQEDSAGIFEDLQFRAHRLQGGAAIFEEPEVARAAGVLEQAAAQARAGSTDAEVRAALESLVGLMGRYGTERAPAGP